VATQAELQAAITLLLANADKFDDVVNGTDSATVTVGSGAIKTLANAVKAIVDLGAVIGFDTKANMDADLAWPAKKVALVLSGAQAGYAYIKSGASGTGSWVQASTSYGGDASDNYDAIVLLQTLLNAFELDTQDEATNPYDGKPLELAVVDPAGRLALGVNRDGTLTSNGVQVSEIDSPIPYALADKWGRILAEIASTGHATINGIEFGQSNAVGLALVVTDTLGRILASVTNEGEVTIEGITAGTGSTVVDETPAWVTMLPNAMVESDYMSVPSYGQSLSLGAIAQPALSTTANSVENYNNKMLVGGVATVNITESRSPNYIALEEQDLDDEGESPVSGTLNYLTLLLGGSDYTKSFVGYASGQGGRSILALSKETPSSFWDTRLTTDLSLAHQAATLLSATHSVPFWTWTQGEADYSGNLNQREYTKRLLALQNDFCSLATSITSQPFRPAMVMYQLAAHRRYSKEIPTIAVAQLQASLVSSDIFIAVPAYCLEYAADNLHLSNEGSRMMGYYYGLAAKRAVWDKNPNTCLKPKRVFRRSNTTVDVVYDLVHSPIRINTAWVATIRNSGFDIRTSTNTLRDIITGVAIVGDDTVRLTTSSPVVAGDKVVYGWGRTGDSNHANKETGPRGNICDSQGDVYQYTGADTVTRRLDNYAVISENII
jgi:hypothetical protein